MRVSTKLLATAAAFAATMALASAPAHAVTVVPMNTSPFSLPGNPSGVIPANTFAVGTNTYDFTFTTIGGTYNTLMQMQASKVANGAPQGLSFELFKGLPGSGVAVAPSGGSATAATLLTSIAAGNYYLELNTTSAPNELVTGGITLLSAVPEPATWGSMILGFGLLGLAARRRRGLSVAAI